MSDSIIAGVFVAIGILASWQFRQGLLTGRMTCILDYTAKRRSDAFGFWVNGMINLMLIAAGIISAVHVAGLFT